MCYLVIIAFEKVEVLLVTKGDELLMVAVVLLLLLEDDDYDDCTILTEMHFL